MRIIITALIVLFWILTLGIFDLEIKFNDGSKFTYKSWIRLLWRKDN